MLKSCVTISLVEEARGGPFVFWDGLSDGFQKAAELKFDAVELFLPGPAAVDPADIQRLVSDSGMKVAAVGTAGEDVVTASAIPVPFG